MPLSYPALQPVEKRSSTILPPPSPVMHFTKVLSSATHGNREAALRRLKESGVRTMTETKVASVKEGGFVVLQPMKEVRK